MRRTIILLLIIAGLIVYYFFFPHNKSNYTVIEKTIETARLNIKYPQIKAATGEAIITQINDLLYSKSFEHLKEQKISGAEEKNSSYRVRYKIERFPPPLLRVRYDESFMRGPLAHPINAIKTLTVRLP